jgi:hypothetical protein
MRVCVLHAAKNLASRSARRELGLPHTKLTRRSSTRPPAKGT